MPVTINGTSGITSPDGSITAPPYAGSTVSTAGVYFPSSNSVAITTNSVQRLSIGSGGFCTYTGGASQNIASLTDGATITPDFTTANNFTVTLGGNRTLANPTSPVAGQSGIIYIVQDGTGSRTLSFGANYKFPSGFAPTLTTTANAVDAVVYTVRSTTSITCQFIQNIG